jgi:hypothetical protein
MNSHQFGDIYFFTCGTLTRVLRFYYKNGEAAERWINSTIGALGGNTPLLPIRKLKNNYNSSLNRSSTSWTLVKNQTELKPCVKSPE